MLKETIQYLQFTIEKHVGGAQAVYRAFHNGEIVISSTNLAWMKKELRGAK